MQRFARLILSVLAASALGHAQGLYWNTASAQSAALGGIYIPSSTGVLDALATNPAGLTSLAGRTADLSVAAAFSRGSFTNSVNTNSPLVNPPAAMPYGALGMPLGKSRFSIAAGMIPEMMTVADWHYVDAPGVAGASYGLQHESSSIIAMRAAVGVGMYVNSKLSIGATIGADYNENTLETPDTFQTQPVLRGLKTLLDLKTWGVGWNTSVGALVQPSKNVQIGLAWKSHTIVDTTGHASGNLTQQLAALGITADPDFRYSAAVRQILPQSVVTSVSWRLNPLWMLALQGDFIDWKSAFQTLPVALTNGNNADINNLVNSTSLYDNIPFQWKDQFSVHAGFERLLTENVSISGGFAHANNPVPSSTLSPMTVAILSNQITTGIGYTRGLARFAAAYAFDPTAKANIGQSALLSGEYSNSTVRLGVQLVTLSMSFRF